GGALLVFSTRSLPAGFAALAALLLAAILVAPSLVGHLLGLLARHAGPALPLAERLALKSARRSLGRIGLAVAALMAATATSIGVGLMVASFRVSVADWLGQLLRAEVYVSQEPGDAAPPLITPALAARFAALPEVAAVSRVRRLVRRATDGGHEITAYELPAAARAGFAFTAGTPATLWPAWSRGEAVIVSAPYAWHRAVEVGDDVTLMTPHGPVTLPIAGIYTDYGSERGVIAIAWSLYTREWGDARAHGLGLYPHEGIAPAALRAGAERAGATHPALGVWSNAEIRQRSLEIFDRTFVITDVITIFAALIAALGVFNALLALHLERAREYAVLRATGCGRALVRRSLYAQTLVVAAAAVALALPLGVAIATLLIEVINVRSFGWHMTLRLT
ncbi:MAG: ABC transporter permease, partial [Gammaproteobacteria bacterium]